MIYPNWRECLALFSSCYFRVPLKVRLLYYFPHILAEYNTWINNLHIFILRFVPKKMLSTGVSGTKILFGSSWWTIYIRRMTRFLYAQQNVLHIIMGNSLLRMVVGYLLQGKSNENVYCCLFLPLSFRAPIHCPIALKFFTSTGYCLLSCSRREYSKSTHMSTSINT